MNFLTVGDPLILPGPFAVRFSPKPNKGLAINGPDKTATTWWALASSARGTVPSKSMVTSKVPALTGSSLLTGSLMSAETEVSSHWTLGYNTMAPLH